MTTHLAWPLLARCRSICPSTWVNWHHHCTIRGGRPTYAPINETDYLTVVHTASMPGASTAGAVTTPLMAGSGEWRSAFDDERVILPCGSSSSIYGGVGPPHLWWWSGSSSPTTAWMCGACRHGGPRAWEARPRRQPLWHVTRASTMVGGVLHSRQAPMYTRGRSTTPGPDLSLAT
jgi:hypothetical protein